jgi:hypothetical protein
MALVCMLLKGERAMADTLQASEIRIQVRGTDDALGALAEALQAAVAAPQGRLTTAILDFVREHAGTDVGGQLLAYDAGLEPVEGDETAQARGRLNGI